MFQMRTLQALLWCADDGTGLWVLLLGFLIWLRNGLEKVPLTSHGQRVGKLSQAPRNRLRCCSNPFCHSKPTQGAARNSSCSQEMWCLLDMQSRTNCATRGELKRASAFQILSPRRLQMSPWSAHILKSTFPILLKWQIKSCVWLSLIFLSCDSRQVTCLPALWQVLAIQSKNAVCALLRKMREWNPGKTKGRAALNWMPSKPTRL